MVIVIHQSNDTRNAFLYNEKKVGEGVASYFHSANTLSVNPFLYSQRHRWKILYDIEKINLRVKKKCLHISVNPSPADTLKLDDKTIRQEVDRMMEHMGYGNQPYFAYKHKDLERVHYHVVSTRIDKTTGKKIRDGYEKDKMQKFVRELEQKYQLKQEIPAELLNLKFTASSGNLKQNLESLFVQLNQMDMLRSKERYDQALGLFQVEIRKAGRGHLVFVTDEQGNPIRHPIRMSDFEEKPKFLLNEKKQLSDQSQEIDKESFRSELKHEPEGFNKIFTREFIKQLLRPSWEDQSTRKNRKRQKNNRAKKKRY